MTTHVLTLTAEVSQVKYGQDVTLKIGSSTVQEFFVGSNDDVDSRAGVEEFIAEQLGALFERVNELKREREIADERRMMYGDDA